MRKQNSIIRILIFVFAALIALLVIGGGIYLFSASKKLKAISLQPDFSETSLEVGTQYTFTINTTPKKASTGGLNQYKLAVFSVFRVLLHNLRVLSLRFHLTEQINHRG